MMGYGRGRDQVRWPARNRLARQTVRIGMDRRRRHRENGGMEQSSGRQTWSARLAGIVLPDSESRPVRLGSLWESGPAVIAFLRHYG